MRGRVERRALPTRFAESALAFPAIAAAVQEGIGRDRHRLAPLSGGDEAALTFPAVTGITQESMRGHLDGNTSRVHPPESSPTLPTPPIDGGHEECIGRHDDLGARAVMLLVPAIAAPTIAV